jgi:hypothetical protein
MVADRVTIVELERALRNTRSKVLDFTIEQLEDTDKLLNDAVMAIKLEMLFREKEAQQ